MLNDDHPGLGIGGDLVGLKAEHRRLDEQIRTLISDASADQLEIARLKKRKLQLKDRIAQIVSSNIPDITA
jgi:hypothetical protein